MCSGYQVDIALCLPLKFRFHFESKIQAIENTVQWTIQAFGGIILSYATCRQSTISQNHIAAFLAITPELLSMIRNKIAKGRFLKLVYLVLAACGCALQHEKEISFAMFIHPVYILKISSCAGYSA